MGSLDFLEDTNIASKGLAAPERIIHHENLLFSPHLKYNDKGFYLFSLKEKKKVSVLVVVMGEF